MNNDLVLPESRWKDFIGLRMYDLDHRETAPKILALVFKARSERQGNVYLSPIAEILHDSYILKPFSGNYLLSILKGFIYTCFYQSDTLPGYCIFDSIKPCAKIRRIKGKVMPTSPGYDKHLNRISDSLTSLITEAQAVRVMAKEKNERR